MHDLREGWLTAACYPVGYEKRKHMKVEETSFLNEYIAMADYGDRLGWHERNGGNFTYWMKPENVADVKDELHDKGEWLPIGTNVDNLANEYFLISGT